MPPSYVIFSNITLHRYPMYPTVYCFHLFTLLQPIFIDHYIFVISKSFQLTSFYFALVLFSLPSKYFIYFLFFQSIQYYYLSSRFFSLFIYLYRSTLYLASSCLQCFSITAFQNITFHVLLIYLDI